MSETVFNRIFTLVGDRGTGKTPFVVGGDFEEGIAVKYLRKNMSLLVIDTLNHPKYRHLQTLHPKNYSILSEKPAMYRTLANPKDMQTVIGKLKNVWNTAIVFEDCYKYIRYTFSDEMRTVVADSKQQNNDLYFMLACWAWVPSDLCRITDYYVIFPTADSPLRKGSELGGCLKNAIASHNLVMNKKKPYIIINSGV